jgi:hypothetical protein
MSQDLDVNEIKMHVRDLAEKDESSQFKLAAEGFITTLEAEAKGASRIPPSALSGVFSKVNNPFDGQQWQDELAEGFEWSREDLRKAVEKKFSPSGGRF